MGRYLPRPRRRARAVADAGPNRLADADHETKERTLNAITLLTDDHATLKKLLTELESTTERGVRTREELFQKVKTELTVHEIIEEEIFYPELKAHPKAKEIVLEGYEEHEVVDILMGECAARPRRSPKSGGSRSADGRRPRSPGRRRLRLDPLDDGGDPLPDADAHRGEPEPTTGPAELVHEHRDEPAAAHPERMAERDRATVHVDLRRVETQLVDADERLRGEGLVELDEVEVVDRDAGSLEGLPARWDRSDPHDGRIDAGHRRREDASHRPKRERLGAARLDKKHG
jgi:hypothetical protein